MTVATVLATVASLFIPKARRAPAPAPDTDEGVEIVAGLAEPRPSLEAEPAS